MATATISPGDEVWTPDSDIPPPPGYTPQAEVWTPAHSAKEGIPPPPGYDTKEKRQDELWSEYSNRWDLLHGPKIDKEYADFHTLDAGDVAQRKADDKTVWKKRYEANSGKLPLGLIISSEPDTLPKAESFVRDLATKTDRADSFNIASTGKLFNESGIEGQFEKATGQKWNEDWSRKYQTLAEAFEKAKPLVKPGALPAADVAAGTRQDLRPDVLLATHALARDQKLGANEGFLDRARQEFYGGLAAIPTAMKTEAETPDQRRYDLALQQARQEGGNVKEPKFWSPEGLSLGAIGLVPAIASGGATSMAQRQTSTRDYLLQQGVSDAAAKTGDAVASLGEWFFLFGAGPKTVLKPFGALLKTDAGKAVEQAGLNLIEKLGGQSAFRKKLLSASAKYLGETAVTSGYVGAASGGYPAFVEEMTKWAAGKNPDAGRVLSETLTAAEHMAPLGAVLHAPELFGNIVKRIDGGGPGPSRSEAEKLGMPAPIADRIESRLAWIESHRPDLLKPPEGAQPEGVVENGKTAETEVNPPTKEVVNEGRDEEGKGVLTPTAQTPGGAEEAPPANPFKAIPIKPAAPEKPAEPPPPKKTPLASSKEAPRAQGQQDAAAGKITPEAVKYAPLHELPEAAKLAMQQWAQGRLQNEKNPARVKALNKIIEDAGKDVGGAVEDMKETLAKQAQGYKAPLRRDKGPGQQGRGGYKEPEDNRDPIGAAVMADPDTRDQMLDKSIAAVRAGQSDPLADRIKELLGTPLHDTQDHIDDINSLRDEGHTEANPEESFLQPTPQGKPSKTQFPDYGKQTQKTMLARGGIPGQQDLFNTEGSEPEREPSPKEKMDAARQRLREGRGVEGKEDLLSGESGSVSNPFDPETWKAISEVLVNAAKHGYQSVAAVLAHLRENDGWKPEYEPFVQQEWDKLYPPAAKPPEEIGIKNAYTEQRREEEGLPERQLPEHRAWEESRQKVEQLPHEDVTRIVDDIRGRDLTKEPVNEYEGWVLGRRTTEVENRLMAARESGDKKATQAAQQELADVLALDERAGTEPARTLAARRAMWDKDFSLVGITRQWIKAKRGPLSEAEWNAAGKLADDVKKAEAGDALADKETTTAVEKIEQQAKGEVPAKVEARFKKFMDIVDQWWNPKVDAARGRLRQYFSAGGKHGALPIDVLPDLAIIGADYIKKGAATLAAFTARLVDEFGEHIREHAREVWDSIDKELDKHEKDLQAHLAGPADTKKPLTSKKPPETKLKEIIKESGKRTAEAKEKSPEAIQEKIDKRFEKDGAITSEMVRELAKAIIKGGTHGVEPVSKAVHDVLLEVDPDISRKESNDLLSGRGQVRLPSKDPVDRELTDIKRQRALIDNIEGLQQNPPEVPQGTGFKRQEPSDTERRLRQKFNEEKKRHPELQAKTPEQLKGAQQAREKAMTNWLNDRYKEIETREKIVKERKPLDMTERLKALQEEKDRVKAIWDETFPEQPRSTEQRQADTLRGIERAANALEADLKAGRLSGKVKGEVPTTAEIDAARAKLQHLKDLREEARASDPKYQADQDARQLATYKRILSSREADLLQQKADMERTGMAPDKAKGGLKTKLDSAAKTQQRRVAKLKQEVKETADSLRANMVEKVGSFLGSVVHGNVFSSLGVASHIGGAIAWKIPGMIVDELSRSLLSRIPGFTEFAGPLEGRGDLPTYAKELFNLKQTGRNMADQVLHGGTLSQTESGEAHPRPVWAVPKPGASVGVKRALRVAENITEGPGRLHAAGKEIERSPAEATARAKMLADAKEHGENVNDPEVKGRIGKVAVEWANRQILQQKTTGDALQRRWTARPDPTTGHKTVKGLAKEIWGHGIQPVFRIGMNFAAEMLERMFGPLAGFTELAWHRVVHGELMKMPAEAREAIARKMVYGVSAIPAMALLGWYNYKSFGGYYMGTQRPKDQKLEPGEVEIAGEKIPEEFTYNPLLSVMQAVAQVRYLIEDYDKHGMSKHGFWSAAAETGSVILERTPLGSESRVMSDLSQPERVEHALGQILKTMVIPGMIAWYAKHTDTQPRDTRGFLGPIKGAIPGFREDLPVKKGKP